MRLNALVLIGLLLSIFTLTSVTAEDMASSTCANEGDCTAQSTELPTALLASPTKMEALISWISRNKLPVFDANFVSTSETYQMLKYDGRTLSLNIEELPSSENGGDIILAEKIISGTIGKVIYFRDTAAVIGSRGHADLSLLLRACDIASVPIALNEATADVHIAAIKAERRAYLIFNPIAGQRDSEEDLAIIREVLEPFVTLSIIETERDLDPADQARKVIDIIKKGANPENSILIASGGDGTVSAIAGATMGSGVTFGIIPRGTANAFSVALGVPTDVRNACRNILRGNTRVVDGAMANDTPMVLLAGIGFEAGMVENAPREAKDKLGCIAYVLGGVYTFFNQETFKCNVDIDGKTLEGLEVGGITVANVAPPTSITAQGAGKVIPDDGLLDVTIAVGNGLLSGLEGLTELVTAAVVQRPTDTESLLSMKAKSVKVSCDPAQPIVIDGEMMEMEPVTFTSLPSALHVLAPPLL